MCNMKYPKKAFLPHLFLTLTLLLTTNYILVETLSESSNFGTVLFSPSDVKRSCFGAEEIALLTARMMLQDLVPHKGGEPKIEDNQYVQDVIDYFRLILEVVREKTIGKGRHIMLLALTDTLGGYMNKVLLPVARYSYYAGNINYASVVQLYQLFEELKAFLRTSGKGWVSPSKPIGKRMKVTPLPVPCAQSNDACNGLIFYREYPKENGQALNYMNPKVSIPMPFFDSKMHPSAMAIPFKLYTLRNVEAKSSAYILLKFFVASRKCLYSQRADQESSLTFQSDFYSFLNRKVVPHLTDDRFFAAFGGVLRIVETLKLDGIIPSSEQDYNKRVLSLFGGAPVKVESPAADISGAAVRKGGVGKAGGRQNAAEYAGPNAESKKKKADIILWAALVTIFFWFLIGTLFVCCKMRAAKLKNKGQEGAPVEGKPSKIQSSSGRSTNTTRNKSSSNKSGSNKNIGNKSISNKSISNSENYNGSNSRSNSNNKINIDGRSKSSGRSNDYKDSKDFKDFKDFKDSKEFKDSKDFKYSKDFKDSKDLKYSKDLKDYECPEKCWEPERLDSKTSTKSKWKNWLHHYRTPSEENATGDKGTHSFIHRSHSPQSDGLHSRGPQSHGPQSHDLQSHGLQSHGPQSHGPQSQGLQNDNHKSYNPQSYNRQTHRPLSYNRQTQSPRSFGSQIFSPRKQSPHNQSTHNQSSHNPSPAASENISNNSKYPRGHSPDRSSGSQRRFSFTKWRRGGSSGGDKPSVTRFEQDDDSSTGSKTSHTSRTSKRTKDDRRREAVSTSSESNKKSSESNKKTTKFTKEALGKHSDCDCDHADVDGPQKLKDLENRMTARTEAAFKQRQAYENSTSVEDSGEEFATGADITNRRQYYPSEYACHTSLTGKYKISDTTSTSVAPKIEECSLSPPRTRPTSPNTRPPSPRTRPLSPKTFETSRPLSCTTTEYDQAEYEEAKYGQTEYGQAEYGPPEYGQANYRPTEYRPTGQKGDFEPVDSSSSTLADCRKRVDYEEDLEYGQRMKYVKKEPLVFGYDFNTTTSTNTTSDDEDAPSRFYNKKGSALNKPKTTPRREDVE